MDCRLRTVFVRQDRPASIYAGSRRTEHTIASQTEALRGFARQHGFNVAGEWGAELRWFAPAWNGFAILRRKAILYELRNVLHEISLLASAVQGSGILPGQL